MEKGFNWTRSLFGDVVSLITFCSFSDFLRAVTAGDFLLRTHFSPFGRKKNRWPFPGPSHLLGHSVQSPPSDGYSAFCLVVGGSFPFMVPGRRPSPFFHGCSASHVACAFFPSFGCDDGHFWVVFGYWCPTHWTDRTPCPLPCSSRPGHFHDAFDAFGAWPGSGLVHQFVASLVVPLDGIVPSGSSSVQSFGFALSGRAYMPVAAAGVPFRWAVAWEGSIPRIVDAIVAIGMVGSESIPFDD